MGYMAQYKERGKVWAKRVLKTTAITFWLALLGLAAIRISDRIPRTIATEQNGSYSAVLQATSSPFMFGSQDGRIVLKKNGWKIQTEDFWIANDGKYMDASNWDVFWENDRVTIKIMGEEQPDEIHTLFYQ